MQTEVLNRGLGPRSPLELRTVGQMASRPAGWDLLALRALCVGMVLLTTVDWINELTGGSRFVALSRYSRAALLGVLLAYFLREGVRRISRGFVFAIPFGVFAFVLFAYAATDRSPLEGIYQYLRILYWIVGSLVAYRLTCKQILTAEVVRRTARWIVAIAVSCTLVYFQTERSQEDYNASAYLLLFTIPLLLIGGRMTTLDYLSLGLAVLGILITVKRGAVLALGVASLGYVLASLYVARSVGQVARIIGLCIILTLFASIATLSQYERFVERTQDEELFDPQRGGSGRLGLWRRLYSGWADGTPVQMVFGRGNRMHPYTHPLRPDRPINAHSDVFAFLYDYGLVGIGLILFIHAAFVRFVFAGITKRHLYLPLLVYCYIALFAMNVYSGGFSNPDLIAMGVALGFLGAKFRTDGATRYFVAVVPDKPIALDPPAMDPS